jgi:hypothetical protein
MRSAPDEGGSALHLGVKHQIKSEAISAKSEIRRNTTVNKKLKTLNFRIRSEIQFQILHPKFQMKYYSS